MKALMDEYGKAILYAIVGVAMMAVGFSILQYMGLFTERFLQSVIGG